MKKSITFEQLKTLVKEAVLVKEYEQVNVVSKTGEHLGCVDDEGNFEPGGYGDPDLGEIVDTDGSYEEQCYGSSRPHSYRWSRRSAWNRPQKIHYPSRIEDDKFFGNQPLPKTKSQAVWYLYQIVAVAEQKKWLPKDTKALSFIDVINYIVKSCKVLGIWKTLSLDEVKAMMDATGKYVYEKDTPWPDEIKNVIAKAIASENLESLPGKLRVCDHRFLKELDSDISSLDSHVVKLACYVTNILDPEKVYMKLLEYYKQDKATRNVDSVIGSLGSTFSFEGLINAIGIAGAHINKENLQKLFPNVQFEGDLQEDLVEIDV